jgi:DNA-binding response OmpR family regulator
MKKILLVEDDDILQRMYQKRLQSEGYEVIQARDGKTGLSLAKSDQPDLILLDIMLPGGLNGFDVLEQLKRDQKTKDIAVLVLTNLDSEEKVAKEIGASGYLVKVNTKPDQVIVKVNELLFSQKAS